MSLIIRDLSQKEDKSFDSASIPTLGPNEVAIKCRDILFISGNSFKMNELKARIDPNLVTLECIKLDLQEIQHSDPLTICEMKCRDAYQQVRKMYPDARKTIMIEDTCLNFEAMKNLPGPYCKWFVDTIGCEGLYKMLIGFDNNTAEAVCTYAIMDDPSRVVFCKGIAKGRIVKPRGDSWAWDPCFEDIESGKTYGEMSLEEKCGLSHRSKAIENLNAYLRLGS